MRPAVALLRAGAGAGGGGTDPYLANVVSLLNMGGADGSTTFTDNTGKIWTPNGNAQIDTSLGFNAGLFDGSGDYISTPSDSSLSLDADYTIEFILRINSLSISGIFDNGASSFSGAATAVIVNHATQANKLSFWCRNIGTTGAILSTNTLSTGVDYHIAFVRSGVSSKTWQDGVSVGATATETTAATVPLSTSGLRVGKYWGGDFNGWIRAFRVTKGVARYTSAFTPPSAPFPTT